MKPADMRDYWETFHRFQRSRERAFAAPIRRAIEAQVRQYLQERKSNPIPRINPQPLIDVLQKLYKDAGVTFGGKVYHFIRKQAFKARMPIGFNEKLTEFILRYFETDLLNNVEDIDATTRKKIEEALGLGLIDGAGIDDITEEIVAAVASRKRARLIVRTESVTAANAGAMMGAKSTGLKVRKVWVAAQDNRTRREPRDAADHLDMNGVTIAFDEFFNVPTKGGSEQMQQPGDRKHGATAKNICNCRCVVAFDPVRDGSGRVVRFDYGLTV